MSVSHWKPRRTLIAGLHLALIAASNYAAFLIRFDGAVPAPYAALWAAELPWLLFIRGATFLPLKLYESLWRYTGIWDVCAVGFGVLLSSVLFGVELWVGGAAGYPRSVLVVDALVLGVAMIVVRIAPRVWTELSGSWRGRRVLVIGAGDAGAAVVREMKKSGQYRPIGFVDDDELLHGTWIHGVQVLGGRDEVGRILAETRPEEALLAIPRADPATVRKFVSAFERFKIPMRTLPYLRESFDGRFGTSEIRNLSANDLLPRAPVGIDTLRHETPAGLSVIKGRRVLVTGAGGSIGSELCRQIAALEPASLVLFERYENSLFALANTLADAGYASFVRSVVGDVGDKERVDGVLTEYAPEIIFHAAAHKHVPLMEMNPCEAVKNNIRGTRILAEAAVAHGVERFVLVSSDKAVYPASVMGASKRVAEMLVQDLAARSDTLFFAVRFGNVLGTNGSVLLTFLEQIKAGGPVTVTHPEVRRYFMLIQEAVQLVLHAAHGQSGGVYVLEMGEPVYLMDLARNAIRLCGFIPEDEIPIRIVGLRPGEKLWEDLVEADEVVEPSHAQNVQRVRSSRPPQNLWLTHQISVLEELAVNGEAERLVAELARTVPTFGQAPVAAPFPAAVAAPATESPEAARRPAPPAGRHAAICVNCYAPTMYRSRARSLFERLQKPLHRSRLYHCQSCGWRGWARVVDVAREEPAAIEAPVNLSALDAADPGWVPPPTTWGVSEEPLTRTGSAS